jgi:hypothetical protein
MFKKEEERHRRRCINVFSPWHNCEHAMALMPRMNNSASLFYGFNDVKQIMREEVVIVAWHNIRTLAFVSSYSPVVRAAELVTFSHVSGFCS